MRGRTGTMAAAALTSLALVATACGGGGAEPQSEATQAGGQGGEISIRGCTPQNPLIPANTNEECGGEVLTAVLAKLVHYNSETAAPELDIAESIDSKDNQNFTVKLKQGYKFHDGTEVKSKNFVDAWNWAAYGPNGNLNAYFFEPIDGFADTQCGTTADGDADCEGKPAKAETMTGLKAVDDQTFTIKTSSKVSNLPVRLGYTAFAPLPDSFFNDPEAFGQKPIGAGPFKLDSKTDTEMVLSKFAEYSGQFKPSVDKATFRIYNDEGAAYNDVVANNLDFTERIPSDRLADDLYKSELEGRNGLRESGVIASTDFSPNDEQFKNNIDLRRAISLAVDRELINKQIFNGTRPPMDGWVSPVVDGFKPGACGEWCTFNPTKAKELYDKSGGYQGTLTLAVNGDAGHKPWADAACNSIKNTLGLECITKVTPDFATLRNQIVKRELKGLARNSWQMDYPSIENFLAPIYKTNASSNDTGYSNPKFDAKLDEAAAATNPDEANKLYQEAEAMLAEDLPSFPMWSYAITAGWSDRITDVKITPFGELDLESVKVK
jgi:oligopeptide transport system substrate-binding protein